MADFTSSYLMLTGLIPLYEKIIDGGEQKDGKTDILAMKNDYFSHDVWQSEAWITTNTVE